MLKSWTLKRYKDGKGASLDLVPQIVRGGPRPFTLLVEDGKLSATLRNAIYHASNPALTMGSTPASLSFEYRDASGLAVRKDFGFDPRIPTSSTSPPRSARTARR